MLDPLYRLVARGIVVFSDGLAPVFGKNSFLSYAIAIVLIVMLVRLLIVPLFVRSVKAQRTMQMLQPHIKEIREKYKNDRQQMNQKIMELQKEHGNPLLGCLPLVLQIPLFISLFHVFRAIAPTSDGHGGYFFKAASGLTVDEVQSIATAKLGGVSLAAAFTNPARELAFLGASGVAVRITCVVLIIVMSTTTFITQKQIMSRNGPADPQQQMIQRVLLYASPLFLAVFGFNFPIAVLLYWLTTNAWSMGQQHFIIKKMPPLQIGKSAPAPAAATGGSGLTSLLKGGSKNEPPAPAPPQRLAQRRRPVGGEADGSGAASGASGANGSGSVNSSSNGAGSTNGSGGAEAANGASAGRSVKPAKAPPGRPANRSGAKKRGGKGGSRRGGRR